MPAPDTLNARIALVKGWTWHEEPLRTRDPARYEAGLREPHWVATNGLPWPRPDFVGTLDGIAGLMRELQEEQARKNEARLYCTDARLVWSWTYLPHRKEYVCILENEDGYEYEGFVSPIDHPGDCVGDAWMSEKGKEDDNEVLDPGINS